jgi:hypothetical protein
MASEIKRKAELTLVSFLSGILDQYQFFPSKGVDIAPNQFGSTLSQPRPPYAAIWIDNAEKTMATERTWILSGYVVWITRSGEDPTAQHAETVREIYNALLLIGSGADPDQQLLVHGLDITLVNEFNDDERRAHGDTIAFTMGVSEFD